VPQPLANAPGWFGCFDIVQVNEDEMGQLGPDPLAVAASALNEGCETLIVTLGPNGAAYFTGRPVRTTRIPVERASPALIAGSESVTNGDATGCGDVFGAAVAAALLERAQLDEAVRLGTRMGTRNLSHRGATGLREHLLGRLTMV
jgi:sugar/nucleoside kinase (ribokinase family)